MPEKKPCDDSFTGRPNLEECLPRDVLQEIMGHLDRDTFCTARQVSKTFCAAASARVCSLTLTSTSKAVSFQRYPHLEHVVVKHAYPRLYNEEKSLAQLQPCLWDLATALTITHKRYKASDVRTRDYLSQAALMPKLRKLEVKGDVKHKAALLARCTNLEAIRFEGCHIYVARAIFTMTRLTSLHLVEVLRHKRHVRSDVSWLGHITNLKGLQTLSISTPDGALPSIGNLTALTGLTLYPSGDEATFSIAPLTRLTGLRSLSLDWDITESNLGLACSLGSGSLVSLELRVCAGVPADCGRLLSRQTALTQLGLLSWQLCNLRHIGALHVELLQCLKADALDDLDAEGLSVLSRATSLTRLSIASGMTEPNLGLSQVLGRLTQLRSLRLTNNKVGGTAFLYFPLALRPLTGLTKLELCGHALDGGVMRALLVLTGLGALELDECRLTPDELPELGRLTSLSALRAHRCGIKNLAPVSKVLDPLRKARGLPPLYISGL